MPMIGRAVRLAAVVAVGLGLVTACGSADRPEDLSLSDVKPCQMILRPRFQLLKVNGGPMLMDTVGGYGLEGSSCKYYVVYEQQTSKPAPPRTSNSVKLSVVTNHGVAWLIDDITDSDHLKYKKVSPVEGYRTVRMWFSGKAPGSNDACELYIDVADEQMLRVNVPKSSGEVDPPTCETARQFAKEALKTLRVWNE